MCRLVSADREVVGLGDSRLGVIAIINKERIIAFV